MWTSHADERLKLLLNGGTSLRGLAKAFGVGRQAVHQRAIKCGLVTPAYGARRPAQISVKPATSDTDLGREALPAGHPTTWNLINEGTCLEGNAYSEPDAGRRNPMIPHPRDPGSPHRAAPFLSKLVACGMLGRAEAIAALLLAGAPAKISRCLRHTRVLPANPTPPAQCMPSRAKAAKAVRDALNPLLLKNATRAELASAARCAASPLLERQDIDALLTDSVARHLRRQRRNSPHPPAVAMPVSCLRFPSVTAPDTNKI
eukprot:gene2000-2035_t